jgi:cilia- and flagella-associated protein 53
LKQQLEDEKRYEKELDRIIEADVERQFQKRLNQWKAEKEARKKLLNEVVAERKQQIGEKSTNI